MYSTLHLTEEEIGQPLMIESQGSISLRYKVVAINSYEGEPIRYTLQVDVEGLNPELVDLSRAGQIALRRVGVEPQP